MNQHNHNTRSKKKVQDIETGNTSQLETDTETNRPTNIISNTTEAENTSTTSTTSITETTISTDSLHISLFDQNLISFNNFNEDDSITRQQQEAAILSLPPAAASSVTTTTSADPRNTLTIPTLVPTNKQFDSLTSETRMSLANPSPPIIEKQPDNATTSQNDLLAQIALLIESNSRSIESKMENIKTSNETLHTQLKQELQSSFHTLTEHLESKINDLTINHDLMGMDIKALRAEQDRQSIHIENMETNLIHKLDRQISDVRNEITQDIITQQKQIQVQLKSHGDTILTTVEQKIKTSHQQIVKDVKSTLDEQNARFEIIEERLNESPIVANSPPTTIHVTCPNNGTTSSLDLSPPKFHGRMLNPQEFLRKLKKFYTHQVNTKQPLDKTEHLHDTIELCLEQHASRWFTLVKTDINNWEDFEAAFNKKYWSYDVQRSIKNRVESEKYRISGNLSRTEYATERILLLRSIQPPLNDIEIINILARHFSELTQDAIRVQNIQNIGDFEALLQREDVNTPQERPRRTLTPPRDNNYPPNRSNSPPRRNGPFNSPRDAGHRPQFNRYPNHYRPPFNHVKQDYRQHPYNSRGDGRSEPPYYPQQQPRSSPPNNNKQNYQQNYQQNNRGPPQGPKQYPTREQNNVCSAIVERSSPNQTSPSSSTNQHLN